MAGEKKLFMICFHYLRLSHWQPCLESAHLPCSALHFNVPVALLDDVAHAIHSLAQIGVVPFIHSIHMEKILAILYDLLDPGNTIPQFATQPGI